MKYLTILTAILWVGMILVMAVNMRNQFLVNQQSLKVIKLYKQNPSVDNIFRNVHDSLRTELSKAEARTSALVKPFPFKDVRTNWLILRLVVVLLTIATALQLWFYYKKPPC
jgi:hypothetical protein